MTVDLMKANAALNAAVNMLADAPTYSGSVCIPAVDVLRWTLTHAAALNVACVADARPAGTEPLGAVNNKAPNPPAKGGGS